MTITWPEALQRELKKGKAAQRASKLGLRQKRMLKEMRQRSNQWPFRITGTNRPVMASLVERELVYSMKYPVLTDLGIAVVDDHLTPPPKATR